MMKRIVLLCFALMTGINALAQQSAEWHPNIAEDNKTATWDETSSWLIGVMNTTNENHEAFKTEMIAQSPSRCTLGVTYTAWWERYNDSWYHHRQVHGHIDLAQLDPLSIRIKNWPDGNHSVYFESKNRLLFFQGEETTRNYPLKLKRLSDFPQTCQLDKKGRPLCEVNSTYANYNFEMWIDDEDIAKRIARALMHSALLCGGTKAVSPF
jgi:hypothetical protein